jgi:hypothetical protein
MTRTTRYFVVESDDPRDLVEMVDVDALVRDVVRIVAQTADEARVDEILAPLAAGVCRIKVMPVAMINDVAVRTGVSTGLAGACVTQGACFPPSLILVPRLDWRRLLGHEMAHLVLGLLKQPQSERVAGRVEDTL